MTALLFAMAALPATMQVLLITAVFGNVHVEQSIRNIVTLFNVLSLEMSWREERGVDLGFDAFRTYQPLVSVGSKRALGESLITPVEETYRKQSLRTKEVLTEDTGVLMTLNSQMDLTDCKISTPW